jgi:hypothetical protein
MVAIADSLSPRLRPKYRVAIEKRVYTISTNDSEESLLVGIADVAVFPGVSAAPPVRSSGQSTATLPIQVAVPIPEEVQERYLEIREVASGRVITVVEILSPKNKRSGEGRAAYEKKRQQILSSATHLIEIDLLRGGTPMPLLGALPPMTYYILVSQANQRPRADLYPFTLQDSIPIFTVPLVAGEATPEVDLQVLLHEVYDRASLDLVIDYRQPPFPNLSAEDAGWADQLLKQQGLRD